MVPKNQEMAAYLHLDRLSVRHDKGGPGLVEGSGLAQEGETGRGEGERHKTIQTTPGAIDCYPPVFGCRVKYATFVLYSHVLFVVVSVVMLVINPRFNQFGSFEAAVL